jgi:hypothetical protein
MTSKLRFPLLLALLLLQGCYSYTVHPAESVVPGMEVRARISAAQAEEWREVLGREDRVLVGELVEATPDRFLLEVPGATAAQGTAMRRLNQRLSLPMREVIELEVRRLDRWRTAGIVALGVGVAGFLVAQAFGSDDGAPPTGPGKGGVDR